MDITVSYLESIGFQKKLKEYDWLDFVFNLEEGSLWQASNFDCKEEVLKTFTQYLNEDDKKIVNSSNDETYNFISSIVKKELKID